MHYTSKKAAAQALRRIANSIIASSPFNMTEIELQLYHSLDKLHEIVKEAKDEVVKFFNQEEPNRDPSELQIKLDSLDEDIRKLPVVTNGFHDFMVRADQAISNVYLAVKTGNVEDITEGKTDLELLAGQIFSEYQKLRQK